MRKRAEENFQLENTLTLRRAARTDVVGLCNHIHPGVSEMQKSDVERKGGNDSSCQLLELVQYACFPSGMEIHCSPIVHVFRKCAALPAIEVTHIVETDENGKFYLPEKYEKARPSKIHEWHEAAVSKKSANAAE